MSDKPIQIDLPGKSRAIAGNTIHKEAYRFRSCMIVISREDVADKRKEDRDFRWHLSIAHPARYPDWEELEAAHELLPDNIHFAMPFPHRAYRVPTGQGYQLDLYEVRDGNLTDQWEYDAIQRRGGEH